MVVHAPAEFVDQRAQGHRRIDAAAGDHHVGAFGQRAGDREAAEIGVHAGDACAAARRRYPSRGCRACAARRARGCRSSPSTTATLSVTPAASQAFSTASRQACGFTPPALVMTLIFLSAISLASGPITTRHEVGGIARLRVAQLLRRHDRHGDFGEIVAHQIVDIAVAHELRGGGLGVAPEAGMAADADCLALGWLSRFFLRLTNAAMRSMCSPSATDWAKASMPACTASSSDSRSQRRIRRFCARTALRRRPRRSSLTQRSTASSSFGRRHDLLDQAPAVGLGGVDVLGGEQQPRGAAPADQARQQRRLDDRRHADLHLGHAEDGVVGGDADVAGRRDLEAGAQRVAFGPADHRHRAVADRLAELVDQGDEGGGRPRDASSSPCG